MSTFCGAFHSLPRLAGVDHTAGNGTRSGNCAGHRETKWHTSPDEMTSCRAAPHRTAPGQRSPTGRAYSRWLRGRPAAHHIPIGLYCIPTPTPPPGVPKHPPRKRKRILPYQGPDDTDETPAIDEIEAFLTSENTSASHAVAPLSIYCCAQRHAQARFYVDPPPADCSPILHQYHDP